VYFGSRKSPNCVNHDRPTEPIVKLVKVNWGVLISAVAEDKKSSALRKNVGLRALIFSWIALMFLIPIL
jgi:hypothetical protein